jgi:hypothetical protein
VVARQVPASPTTGANVAGIAAIVSQNPQFRGMLPLSSGDLYLSSLQSNWLETDCGRSISSFCAFEVQNTYGVRVVTQESATNLCNSSIREINTDHIEIVKPRDTDAEPYKFFRDAYEQKFGSVAHAVATALSSRGNTETPLPLDAEAPLAVRKSGFTVPGRTWTTTVEGKTKCKQSEDFHIDLPVKTGESLLQVFTNTDVQGSSVAVVKHDQQKATLRVFARSHGPAMRVKLLHESGFIHRCSLPTTTPIFPGTK